MVTDSIIGHKALASYDVNSLFPLYIYPTEEQEHLGIPREPNLDGEFIKSVSLAIGVGFVTDGSADLQDSFGPENIFHYIYAVLSSPEYRHRYADFLKSDFPRVPLPGSRALFLDLIRPGGRLASVHLMEGEDTEEQTILVNAGSNRVDKVRYTQPSGGLPERVEINREQYFEGIEPGIWNFTIGGYRPAEKWLKDRKGRVLSNDDIDHYRKIVAALAATGHLMEEVDELIDQHGGWPGAFQSAKVNSDM